MLPTIILKIERWKFNKDFGVYVSTQGNFKDRHKRRLPIMINNGGYVSVKTERGNILAHRLVMFTWRPIPNAEALTVDHLDHNKRNNAVDNLEWVTKEENLRRAISDLVPAFTINDFHLFINGIAFDNYSDIVAWYKKNIPCVNENNISEKSVERVFTTLVNAYNYKNKHYANGYKKSYHGAIVSIERK